MKVAYLVLISLLTAVGTFSLFFKVYKVESSSMEPLICARDLILCYKSNKITEGSVIVFEKVVKGKVQAVVKSCMASGPKPVIYINPYYVLQSEIGTFDKIIPCSQVSFTNYLKMIDNYDNSLIISSIKYVTMFLQSDEVFVKGINTDRSKDSRQYGPIKMNQIVGKVALIFPYRSLRFRVLKS